MIWILFYLNSLVMDTIKTVLQFLKENRFFTISNTTSKDGKTTWIFRYIPSKQQNTFFDLSIERYNKTIEFNLTCVSYKQVIRMPKCVNELCDLIDSVSRVVMFLSSKLVHQPNVQQVILYARV